MATIFVDLVNLDGSRPEGRLKFSLEQLRVGDPDVVPSSVEAVILDGKARVENLLPGEMKVQVNTGRWSKEWPVVIPDNGTHDLFDLLGVSAPEFEETAWAVLSKRVEALEQAPPVDLAPLEKRVEVLEQKPEPAPFDPADLKAQLAELQAHFTPVDLVSNADIEEALTPIYETGTTIGFVQHAGRVSISFRGFDIPGLLQALGELKTSHFPKAAMFADGEDSNCSVELYQGAKFLTKIEPRKTILHNRSGELTFQMALNEVLAVVQETGATNIYLSTSYYTDELPPETE